MDADLKEQEERVLKKAAIFIMVISVVACMALPYFLQLQTATNEMLAKIKEYRTKTQAERMNMTGIELLEYNNEQARQESDGELPFQSQLRLELPLGVKEEDVEIVENYLTQTVDVRIPYAGENYMYEHPILGSGEHMESLTYESGQIYGEVRIALDMVYELNADFDEDYLYLDFFAPQELYDKVVVIDAGHGGAETGITKQGICEKDINLDIALKLKEIFEASDQTSIGVYYTRTTDENPDALHRIGLGSKTEADLFLSIHGNSTESGRMTSINGIQVLYDGTNADDKINSKGLAQICLEELLTATGSSNKGLVTNGDGEGIVGSGMPAVSLKVGFLTNQEELSQLCSPEYQEKVAQGIYNAILRAFKEGY